MLLTSLAMGRTHPAWGAPPELPAGTMLTDIKRTMLRDLALMHQSQMPTSDSSTSPSRKDPTTSITINAVAARQIEVKLYLCVIGRAGRQVRDPGELPRASSAEPRRSELCSTGTFKSGFAAFSSTSGTTRSQRSRSCPSGEGSANQGASERSR